MAFDTKVLECDSKGITFTSIDSSSPPKIASAATAAALKAAVHELSLGRPVVIPTETVYGLAATAMNDHAVAEIFAVKSRPADNPLIVHVSSLPMLRSLLPEGYTMSPSYEKLIRAFWPGPLTLLFPTHPSIPSIVTAGHPTVAVRFPSHPVARALIALANAPLAAPSANSSGKPSPTKASHVLGDLAGKVSIILDGGPCDVGVESTVVDGLGRDGAIRVLRPGGVTVEDLDRALNDGPERVKILVHKRDYQDEEVERAPTTPGMKYRHYAPSVPVVLLMTSTPPPSTTAEALNYVLSDVVASLPPKSNEPHSVGLMSPPDSRLTRLLAPPSSSFPHACRISDQRLVVITPFNLGLLADPAMTAQRLFDGLLTLEKLGVDVILIEGVEESKEGLAVMNRVRKAAGEVRWVKLQ